MTALSRYTILNVDDNAAGRYARSRILKQAGFQIVEAGTGEEALRTVSAAKPDLVLLDVHLPDMNGFDVCKRIKADVATARVLIVQMSATSVDNTDRKRGLEEGADGYLTEPVDPDVLIATVNAFLRLRRAEEALRESEERFRRTFEAAPIGMMLFAPGEKIVESNNAVVEMLGFSAEELRSMNLVDLTHPDDRETQQSFDDQLLQKKVTSYEVETRCLTKNHSLIWVNLTATTIQDSGGKTLGVAMVENVTERRRSEKEKAELLAAEQQARSLAEIGSRTKDEFLATLSHELRTPLNAILGWTRMLRTEQLDASTTAQALETIERNAEAQAQLIGDLLDVSRIISGKFQLNVQSVQLRQLIETALETLRLAAEAKQIQFKTFLEETEPITGDPGRLKQVIWNLLSNAIKFTPEGGTVEIRLTSVDHRVELKVVDTGLGMDPSFLPFAFDRFRQADSSSGRPYGGLGLGLAIVRHLVELHGGSVEAQSNGPGLGTAFVVKLSKRMLLASPASSNEYLSLPEPSPSLASKSVPRLTLNGVSVLVVDDDPDARELLAFILQQSGAIVRVAASAADALEVLASWKPTVLLADIGLPGLDGYELIRRVRSRESDSDVPLPAVALTAYASPRDHAEALQAGFQQHIIKPIEPVELISTIAGLVKRGTSVSG
jgi:PAS domain S-box-containing protein